MREASAFWAHPLPLYPGRSMFPQALRAVELSIHKVISSICAAAKPAWASLEPKRKCEHLSQPSSLSQCSPPLQHNYICSFFHFAHTFLHICFRLKWVGFFSFFFFFPLLALLDVSGWRCENLKFEHPFCHVHATLQTFLVNLANDVLLVQ